LLDLFTGRKYTKKMIIAKYFFNNLQLINNYLMFVDKNRSFVILYIEKIILLCKDCNLVYKSKEKTKNQIPAQKLQRRRVQCL
jgi:hypothetical protein